MPTGETPAAGTPSPVPPPPPTAAATASSSPPSTHRRRHRTFSSSSSPSSSLSTVSSAASSPSPSPRGRGATTTTTTITSNTSVPFSWEHHPGIPKTRLCAGAGTPSSAPTPLPLPPPLRAPTTSRLRHHQHVRRRRATGKPPSDAADPFAAALAECTREHGGAGSDDASLMDTLFPARAPPAPSTSAAPTSRRWSIASAGGVVGLLDLYGCKNTMCGVAEGAFVVRRPVSVVRRAVPAGRAGPGRAGRR